MFVPSTPYVNPKETHTQCKLRLGNVFTVSWLPTRYAEKGRVLELLNDDGEWENGWIVVETYATLPSSYVIENERNHLKQRRASDI